MREIILFVLALFAGGMLGVLVMALAAMAKECGDD